VFKRVRDLALERLCARERDRAQQIAAGSEGTNHARYLALYHHVERSDKELAKALNDPWRSAAQLQLALMCRLGLVADEEQALFSEEMRRLLRVYASL
jgi:hypothetical protein